MKRKVLILELWGLGDLTFSTVLLQEALNAGDTLHLVGKNHARSLLEPTFPNIRFFSFDAEWTKFQGKYHFWKWKWRAFFSLLLQLRREHYDVVASVRNDPRDHFLMWLIGAKNRYGFPCDGSGIFLNRPVVRTGLGVQHKVEDWRDIGVAMGLPKTRETTPFLRHSACQDRRINALLKGTAKPVLCMHVGARISVRRWPERYFEELIGRLRKELDFHLVLIPDLDGFGARLAPLADAVGEHLTIPELVDIMGRSDLVLCVDSGPGHIAAACGRPVIVFFGPTDAKQFRPFGDEHKVVIRDICPKRPCFDYCSFPEPYCMTRLSLAEVWPEVREHILHLAKRGIVSPCVVKPQAVSPLGMEQKQGEPNPETPRLEGLKILQIFSRYLQWGGEEGSVYRIGDALMERHQVEYYMQSSAKLLSKGKWTDKIRTLGTVFHNHHAVRDLRRMQDICQFDIWQVHNVLPALSPAVYKEAFRANIPIVQYLHNYRMGCLNGFFLDHGKPCRLCQHGNFLHAAKAKCWQESHLICAWMGLVMQRFRALDVFHNVSRWIAISEAEKAVHVEIGIPEDRIDVIHHFYTPTGPALPIPEEGYALFVGRLSVEKGCMELLQAWRAMPFTRKLIIAGDGPERIRLQEYAASAGLTNVQFLGFVPKPQQEPLWRGAAFLVVPSIWMEPFGMVVLEAWSHGRPVVANAIGALPELITHGKTGLLVPPLQPEALASEMERLFQSPSLLQAMAQQARMELETHFSKADWVRQLEQTYSKIFPTSKCITKF